MMELVPLQRDQRAGPLVLCRQACRQPSMSQEAGPDPTENLPVA